MASVKTRIVVACLAACTVSPCVVAGDDDPVDLATRFETLELGLSLTPARVLPGEPVNYRVTLRNPTSEELPGDVELEGGENPSLWIRLEGGGWRYHDGSAMPVAERMPRVLAEVGSLPAGAARETTGVMQATRDPSNPDLKGFAFTEPGRYEVKARVTVPVDLEGDEATIESAPVELIVERPIASDDQVVWEALGARPESAWFLQHGYVGNWVGDPRNPDLAATLEALLSEHPDGRYARTIRDSLRRHRDLRVRHKLQR